MLEHQQTHGASRALGGGWTKSKLGFYNSRNNDMILQLHGKFQLPTWPNKGLT